MAKAESAGPDAVQVDPGALGHGKLRQLIAYATKVFHLQSMLALVTDTRHKPRVQTALVAQILLVVGLLRIRSFNALEPQLAEPWMQRALGLHPKNGKLCSADALSYSLKRMDDATTREACVRVVKKAERNKVFREGWFGAMRFVAIDGWEPHCSYERHCPACLTRQVRVGDKTVTQYYHRYVVALLLDEKVEVVLDMEPVRSADIRCEYGEHNVRGHEGELTAAKRLVPRLRETYGNLLDVLTLDALYCNGPFFTLAEQHRFGVIAVAKKADNEPLKEALSLWGNQPPHIVVDDKEKRERLELWDVRELRTLSSYKGSIRVVRALAHKNDDATTSTNWCFAVTGKATKLSAFQVACAGRARWHIENTAFYQFAHYWHFAHVFTHGGNALPSLLWIFFLAFNLLQLFLYRQLGGYGRDRGKDPTRTILRLVDEFKSDLARLLDPLAWNTS